MLKRKDGYKPGLQTPEAMNLFGSTKKITDKTKNRENESRLELVEAMLVCNLLDNQYQQKSAVLCNFTLNKSYVYLLNVEPSNLLFLKAFNTEFNKIIITFMDQNDGPIEIEDTVNLILLINNIEMKHSFSLAMQRYSIEPRKRYVKGYRIFSFARKAKKQLLDTGLDVLKTASKK